jgi:transcriptional regulator with PAS, ATPase and Fis domain
MNEATELIVELQCSINELRQKNTDLQKELDEPTPLEQHITDEHDGNKTAFAATLNVSRQTVYEWIYKDAHWWKGDVWVPMKRGEL